MEGETKILKRGRGKLGQGVGALKGGGGPGTPFWTMYGTNVTYSAPQNNIFEDLRFWKLVIFLTASNQGFVKEKLPLQKTVSPKNLWIRPCLKAASDMISYFVDMFLHFFENANYFLFH